MRHVGHFNPEWGYLAPAPGLMRTARVFIVAVVIGATASAAVVFSLIERPAAEASVAARTLVLSAEPSQPARDSQRTAQQPAQSARDSQPMMNSETPGAMAPHAAVAAHANIASPAANESGAAPAPQSPPAAAALAESPRITATDPPPAQALARENNTALTVEAAPAPTPVLKGAVKKPRAVARAAVPPRYDVPRYAAPRYEPRYEAMQRGPYAFLRQYGSFGQEYR
jgi:hypothetical protein